MLHNIQSQVTDPKEGIKVKEKSLTVPVLAILACFLWSTAFLGVKVGLRYSQPFSFAGMRFMIAGLLLVPVWWKMRPPLSEIWANKRTILLVSFFQTFLGYSFFYTGMTMIAGALAAIVIGAAPLITAVMAHFFMQGDKMTLPKTISLLIGMTGVAVISISRQPWSTSGFVESLGLLCLFGAVVSGSFGNILVAKRQHTLPSICLASLQIFLGGLSLFTVSLFLEGRPTFGYPPEFYIALGWLSFVSATAFSLWFTLLRRPGVKISGLNLWKFVIPVSGAILSWTLLPEETPSLSAIVGMILIVVSIISFNWSGLPQTKTALP